MLKKLLSLSLAAILLLSLAGCEKGDPIVTLAPETTAAPQDSTAGGDALEPEEAPDFTVYTAEGTPVKLSDMRGIPVVLNFWASWCPPCKAEMPDFNEICKEFEGKVAFMMVNLTDGTRETVESARNFIHMMEYTFPVYYDTDMDATGKYGIQSIPTTYFISAEGKLIAYGSGSLDGATLRRGIGMIYAEAE
jgi:thiol-disulfide isomerase/thioredoxin